MSVPLLIPATHPVISSPPPDAVFLDASWLYDPPPERNAKDEYTRGPRLPGARWWDLEEVSEPSVFPLMLPSPERFAAYAAKLGIGRESWVIIYDNEGIFASPRTAWIFTVYGHERVSVINGGLKAAIQAGVQLESGPPGHWNPVDAYPMPELVDNVAQFDAILALARDPNDRTLILDARPESSFDAGHIPHAALFDFPSSLLHDSTGYTYIRDAENLKAFLAHKLGKNRAASILAGETAVINSCGGGLTAAINWLHLKTLGIDSVIYDEAWAGYSSRPHAPRATVTVH